MISVLDSGLPARRKKIDFDTLVEELASRNVVFLADVHTALNHYASNQFAVISALRQRWGDELVIGLEYAGREEIQDRHLPILELGEVQYLGIPGIDERILKGEISAFGAYGKMEERCVSAVKENLSRARRMAIVFGKQHLHHENSMPFRLNGNSQVSVVYQTDDEAREEGVFRVLKSSLSDIYRGKGLYEIVGKLS